MLLPQSAEYALRALSCLLDLPAGTGLRSSDLAERSGVPAAYLQKVLRRLVEAGLLDSRKGHGGGFRLARAPGSIRFADVLDAMDSEPPKACAFGWDRCDASHPCPLHPAYAALRTSFDAWASGVTLADVDPTPPRKARRPKRAVAKR